MSERTAKQIHPADIDLDKPIDFGKHEVNKVAKVILLHCQQMSHWLPFSLHDLERIWHEVHGTARDGEVRDALDNFLNPLRGDFGLPANFDHLDLKPSPFIIAVGVELYQVTPAFVERCWQTAAKE